MNRREFIRDTLIATGVIAVKPSIILNALESANLKCDGCLCPAMFDRFTEQTIASMYQPSVILLPPKMYNFYTELLGE